MTRSFDYCGWCALRRHWQLLPADHAASPKRREVLGAQLWGAWLSREFVRAYVQCLHRIRPELLPNRDDTQIVLRSWVLEKALYEVRYELNSRPDWADIPLRAVVSLIGLRETTPANQRTGPA
jgi:maltose alpha-D-glucosyltransferase/alpha-amylase